MIESQKLLADYTRNGSEPAFRDLVNRYINLVHSAALRLVNGDSHMAEDITQMVFIDLAQKAHALSSDIMLGGWLHERTYHVAAPLLRAERRRRAREKEAAQMNAADTQSDAGLQQVAPILDEAIMRLGREDHRAIILRFFEQRDFRSIGAALGTTDDAAQKRVARAIEKLHAHLTHRGVTLSVAALGAVLASGAVTAAPAGLAASVAGTALTAAATGTGTTLTLLKFMATTKLKTGIISAIVVASVVAPLVVQHQAQARLHGYDETSRLQTDRLAEIQQENERLSNLLGRVNGPGTASDAHSSEVLKLRGEISRLRRAVQELTQAKTEGHRLRSETLSSLAQRYSARIGQLKQFLATHPSERTPELQFLTENDWLWLAGRKTPDTEEGYQREMSLARQNAQENVVHDALRPALQQYAQDNNGRFPNDLSQLKPYFKTPIDEAILQRWQILPAKSLPNLLDDLPGEDLVVTQKAPVNAALDQRIVFGLKKVRSFADAPPNQWDTLP